MEVIALQRRSVPVPWDAKVYADLRASMNSIPEGELRDDALERIETLDCGNPDKTLASCDPAAAPPPEVLVWQKMFAAASVQEAAYAKALAEELRHLVCESPANSIGILRGMIGSRRLRATGPEAPVLVDFIKSEKCSVSSSLTEDDKARLMEIKQWGEEHSPPAAAANNKK